MAEAALYGNHNELPFPFESAVDAFRWVPRYIDSLTPKRKRHRGQSLEYSMLINILLVVSRARTSTLITNEFLDISLEFSTRLNRSLHSLPRTTGAAHHRIELVPRRHASFFVVCERSPRFIWSRSLSHHEVGLNLDFGAPGHIFGTGIKIQTRLDIFEIHGPASYQITSEIVYLDRVEDIEPINDFYRKRTDLFNQTMIQLAMPYRFMHFWRINKELERVMQSSQPPSPEWWAKSYVYICNLAYGMTFVSVDCQFSEHWSTLRAAYNKIISSPPIFMECSEATEKLFGALYILFQSNGTRPLLQSSFLQYSSDAEIIALLESLELFSPMPCKDDYPIVWRSDLRRFFKSVLEVCRMRIFERWKLREPLVYRLNIPEVWYDYGHETWCRDPLRLKFRNIFTKSFWCDKVVQD